VVSRVLADVGTAPTALGRAAYRGVPGHPVVLGREHWHDVVGSATGDRGARAYLAAHPHRLVECGDLASGADVDAAADLE
jgi:CTP:molybdopterin cytidylyltransferase MocA